jgi:hypothetical protein
MKKEVESRTRWDMVLGSYEEFLIRDTERRLAGMEEFHNSVATPYSIPFLEGYLQSI